MSIYKHADFPGLTFVVKYVPALRGGEQAVDPDAACPGCYEAGNPQIGHFECRSYGCLPQPQN